MAVLVFVMLDLLSRWKMVCCFDGAIIVRGTGMSTRVCFLRGADVCLDVNCAGRRVTYMRQNGAETGPYNGAYGEPEWGCRAESVLNQRVLWGADSPATIKFSRARRITRIFEKGTAVSSTKKALVLRAGFKNMAVVLNLRFLTPFLILCRCLF